MPPVVAAAGIAAGAGIVGGIINSRSARGAANIEAQTAQQALAEQRRIYDLERQREEQDRQDRLEAQGYDRRKTEVDERRVRGSRQNAFGGFGSDLSTFSRGYAPAYGMSGEQTQGLLDARNAGFSANSGASMSEDPSAVAVALNTPYRPDPMSPQMPTPTPGTGAPPMSGPPVSAGAFGSTVWLQAPTGEQMEVSIQDAEQIQQMLQAGAILIPAPQGGPR